MLNNNQELKKEPRTLLQSVSAIIYLLSSLLLIVLYLGFFIYAFDLLFKLLETDPGIEIIFNFASLWLLSFFIFAIGGITILSRAIAKERVVIKNFYFLLLIIAPFLLLLIVKFLPLLLITFFGTVTVF